MRESNKNICEKIKYEIIGFHNPEDLPIKCVIAEKQDIREEQMTVTNSVIICEAERNNSVLISVLTISNKAIVNKGHVKTDVLNIVGNYVAYSTSDIDGSGIDGCLISINPTGLEGAQIKVAYNMSIIEVRAAYNVDGAAKMVRLEVNNYYLN